MKDGDVIREAMMVRCSARVACMLLVRFSRYSILGSDMARMHREGTSVASSSLYYYLSHDREILWGRGHGSNSSLARR